MARVPEYGIHDGIKYNKKRSLIRWCIICGKPFHPTGKRDKVCGDECRSRKEQYRDEDKNAKRVTIYQPPKTEQERRRRNNYWKVWYANLTIEQKIEYLTKKRRNARIKKQDEEPQQSTDAELDAMYAELGLPRR